MKLNSNVNYNRRKIDFNPRGGYPRIVSDLDGYYVELPYCKTCSNTVEKFEVALGILLQKGFYCNECGEQLKSTLLSEISKKEFDGYEQCILQENGVKQ